MNRLTHKRSLSPSPKMCIPSSDYTTKAAEQPKNNNVCQFCVVIRLSIEPFRNDPSKEMKEKRLQTVRTLGAM